MEGADVGGGAGVLRACPDLTPPRPASLASYRNDLELPDVSLRSSSNDYRNSESAGREGFTTRPPKAEENGLKYLNSSVRRGIQSLLSGWS